jgi:alpha-beta hydrolase superfamily lysophospholipase
MLAALAVGAALLLEACTPQIIMRGTESVPPRLDGESFVADDGVVMRVRRWLPDGRPGSVIIAVHGMNEHGKAFEWPAEFWRDNGIVTYAFDQRGFGRSPDRGIWPGAENMARDLTQFIRQVRARHPDLPIFLLGESMGGGVALLAAARPDLVDVQGVILVAPAVAPWEKLPIGVRSSLWVAAHTIPWFVFTGEGLDLRPTDNIEVWREMSLDEDIIRGTRADAIYGLTQLMDRAARAAPGVRFPVLLLYGKRDDFVRQWMVDWLASRLPEGRFELVRYDDGYHWLLRDLKPEKVHATILEWMAGRRRED